MYNIIFILNSQNSLFIIKLSFSLSDTNSQFSAVSVIKVALIGMTAVLFIMMVAVFVHDSHFPLLSHHLSEYLPLFGLHALKTVS